MSAGGYKKPTKPAAVSGPGRYAKRTDGGVSQPIRDMTGGAYGDATDMHDIQASAPMNASARQGTPPVSPQAGPPAQAVPLDAPTQNPNEPVTAGNPMGAGPGPEVLPQQQADLSNLMSLLPVLNHIANGPNGTPSLRNLVRTLKGQAT